MNLPIIKLIMIGNIPSSQTGFVIKARPLIKDEITKDYKETSCETIKVMANFL